MKHWIDETCEVGPSLSIRATALYENYKRWCESSAIKPISMMVFSRKMIDRGYARKHTRAGNVYQGITIRSGHLAMAA